MSNLGELLGKPRTPLVNLFSDDVGGWIDNVDHDFYPTLVDTIEHFTDITTQAKSDLTKIEFQFPQSLDDFGFHHLFNNIYANKYKDYLNQWTASDDEVIHQQIEIQEKFQTYFPRISENAIYFMISNITSVERVVYVGIAKRGLLMRFMNGNSIRSQNNNYIGDCRSYESKSKPNYTWRAKSAELRRRGVSSLAYTTLEESILKDVEKEMIIFKRSCIEGFINLKGMKDPINR